MAEAYIAVGSNVRPENNIPEAVELLSYLFTITGISSFYRNPPLGKSEQDDFVNGMIRIETVFPPLTLKTDMLMELEEKLERVRTEDKDAPRTIDLDLVLYGEELLKDPSLILPAPDLLKRNFLYVPLLEIAPDILFPGTDRKVSGLIPKGKVKTGLKLDIHLTRQTGEIVNGKAHP